MKNPALPTKGDKSDDDEDIARSSALKAGATGTETAPRNAAVDVDKTAALDIVVKRPRNARRPVSREPVKPRSQPSVGVVVSPVRSRDGADECAESPRVDVAAMGGGVTFREDRRDREARETTTRAGTSA
jgi:hypothetical protein